MATFRKINLSIEKLSGYGQYKITGEFKNKTVTAHTTNSECYDWLDDDSNKEKHSEAKRYAYNLIKQNS